MRSCALSAGGGREGGGSAHPPATFSVPASGADGVEGWNAAPRAACGMRVGWGEVRRSPFRFVSGPARPLLFLVFLLCSFLLRLFNLCSPSCAFGGPWSPATQNSIPCSLHGGFPACILAAEIVCQRESLVCGGVCVARGLNGFFTSSFWVDHAS